MRHFLPSVPLCLLATVLSSPAVRAQGSCSTPSDECVPVGEWDFSLSLGGGVRTNPVRDNSAIPLAVLPELSYYGRRFFLENLELGFTVHESRSQTFNLVAAPGYDRVFFFRNDLQNLFVNGFTDSGAVNRPPMGPEREPRVVPLERRHTTFLAGPEWSFNYGRLIGQLNALYEVTGRHSGYEVRAAAAAPIVQSQSNLTLSAGVTWKSAEVVGYYYEVEGVYEQPGAALNPFIKLSFSRPLNERWSLNAFAHYERLDSDVVDSPIVTEPDVTTVFAGFDYKIF